MTHQHGSGGSGGSEEVKDGSQHQTSSTAAAGQPQPTQCCVFFAPSEWSRRYGEEFYTARVTAVSRHQPDGSHSYAVTLRCADSEWCVERPYSAFTRLNSDIAASYRPHAGAVDALPPLPADKADPDDVQRWMDGTLQRKDISRLSAVRRFLELDRHIQHTPQQQDDDSEDERQTAAEGEDAESKQTAAAQQ